MEKQCHKSLQSALYQKTLYLLAKNKDKMFEATKKESNSKHQRLRQCIFANLDQAMFKWLLVVRSRDVAVSTLVSKTKAIDFAEKMKAENFKASHGWLDRWKK